MSFPAILTAAQSIDGGFRAVIPESWHQGRTAYGGLSAALALVAARQAGGEGLPPLRSAQVSFVGPLYGAFEARAKVLRRGRNVVWIEAEVLREGEVGLSAVFAFMRPVESKLHLQHRVEVPGLVPVEEAQLRPPPSAVRLFEHLEVRFAVPRAHGPRAGERRPEICWWVRATDREGLDPALQLLLCADAPPPGVFPLFDKPIPPISSMTWLVNLLMAEPVTHDGWWLMRVTGDYAENGCSSDRTEIWNTEGDAVSLGMQSVAVFG